MWNIVLLTNVNCVRNIIMEYNHDSGNISSFKFPKITQYLTYLLCFIIFGPSYKLPLCLCVLNTPYKEQFILRRDSRFD